MENQDSKRITFSKEETKDTTSRIQQCQNAQTSRKGQHQLETQETTLSKPTTAYTAANPDI